MAAITARVGLHENTVRGHLDALLNDGFVTRTPADPDGRGRPGWLWSATAPAEQSAGAIEYQGLASALARTIATTAPDPAAAARETGRTWGASLTATQAVRPAAPDTPPQRRVVQILDDLGFAPAETTVPAHTATQADAFAQTSTDAQADTSSQLLELHRCPILEAATSFPEVVCNVHMGLISGILEADGVGSEGSYLEPFAAPGVCLLHLKTQQLAPQQLTSDARTSGASDE